MVRKAKKKTSNAPAKKKSKAKPKRRSLLGFLTYWAVVVGLWVLILSIGVVAYYAADLPDSSKLLDAREGTSIQILALDGSTIGQRGALYGGAVDVDELPDYMKNAVIAVEDRHFYYHPGFDPVGIGRAIWANYKADRVRQGASTITQQLAKNLFLSPRRTFRRKIQEVILSVWLETKFTKDEILTIYLNRVYLGSGTYGIEAAAQRYFGKSARTVTLPEAALLAGLLKAPTRYAPTANLKRSRDRAAVVIQSMRKHGFLSQEEAMAAVKAPASLKRPKGGKGSSYFVDWVLDEVTRHVGDPEQDLVIVTTLDPELQRLAGASVEASLAQNGGRLDVEQGALISLDIRGAVRAMVGGRSYAKSQFNRATQAQRQPGSAFKPLVYLAALEEGLITPQTTLVDEPVRFGRYAPKNYSKRYRGEVTAKQALTHSVNTIAVKLIHQIGPRKVIDMARRLGITSPLTNDLSLALGASEVSLLELTQSYAAFANGGDGVLTHGVIEIRTKSGDVLYRRSGSGIGPVMSAYSAGAISDMLSEVMISGTGRRARLSGRPAAGKTGTSSDFKDAWFVGYTAELVTGVWVGNDNSSAMNKVTGGSLPAGIWRDYMSAALEGMPYQDLPRALPAARPRTKPGSGQIASARGKKGFWDRFFGTVGNGGSRRKKPGTEDDFDYLDEQGR